MRTSPVWGWGKCDWLHKPAQGTARARGSGWPGSGGGSPDWQARIYPTTLAREQGQPGDGGHIQSRDQIISLWWQSWNEVRVRMDRSTAGQGWRLASHGVVGAGWAAPGCWNAAPRPIGRMWGGSRRDCWGPQRSISTLKALMAWGRWAAVWRQHGIAGGHTYTPREISLEIWSVISTHVSTWFR